MVQYVVQLDAVLTTGAIEPSSCQAERAQLETLLQRQADKETVSRVWTFRIGG